VSEAEERELTTDPTRTSEAEERQATSVVESAGPDTHGLEKRRLEESGSIRATVPSQSRSDVISTCMMSAEDCHTLAFKIRPESSYVCPGSPHIQQKTRNIRNNVIYSGKHIYNNTYKHQSTRK